jgi:dephospho-CoA kinase
MIEVGSWRRYDKLVVAVCPEGVQVARAMARDHASEAEVRARLARQMPLEEKARLADYRIDTSGTLEQTMEQTRMVWKELVCAHRMRREPSAPRDQEDKQADLGSSGR